MRRHAGVQAGGPLHTHTDQPRNPDLWDFGPPLDWPENPVARPYLDAQGGLVIPTNCPRKYRWWAGGQSASRTLQELVAGVISPEPPPAWRGAEWARP